MPPDAISRSSTYLPKTCGNIAHGHRSAVCGLSLLFLGCSPEPGRVLQIRAHELLACAPPETASLQLFALGDFDVSNSTVEVVEVSAREQELVLPFAARAVAARQPANLDGFHGVAERSGDAVDFLLWPNYAQCELTPGGGADAGKAYPTSGGGQALGVSVKHHVLLVAGGKETAGTEALALDLDTGQLTKLVEFETMHQPHEHGTVTEFGDDLLVAAGTPRDETRAYAEVFEPSTGHFRAERRIELSYTRRRHAAVVLQSGETLLVGGLGDNDTPRRNLELVSPVTGRSRIDLPAFGKGRVSPNAVLLSDGRVLVTDGIEVTDGTARAASSLVWLSDTAESFDQTQTPEPGVLPARFNRAAVAMPGGSALLVGGCEDRAPGPGEDCVTPCGALPDGVPDSSAGRARGCPPQQYEAWWLTAQGTATRLPDLPAGFDFGQPALVPATDGAPWLIASGTSLRFEPWTGLFRASPLPALVQTEPDGPAPLAIDAGAFVWLGVEPGSAQGLSVLGFRHDTRNRFENDLPLLVTSPSHVAPNQAPLGSGSVRVFYDGALHLLDESARAEVTETTYLDFRISLFVSRGPPPRLFAGDRELRWPDEAAPVAPQGESLELTRQGTRYELVREGARRSFSGSSDRVSVALGGTNAGETVVTRLEIARIAVR